jgi:hypothetical protein
MGLFALTADDATAVDKRLETDSRAAFDLAKSIAKKTWAGDRTFCEDGVRMTIGFLGTDGKPAADDDAMWKSAELDAIKAVNIKAIDDLHTQITGKSDRATCERTLATYVEALRYAASEQLELRNFGY